MFVRPPSAGSGVRRGFAPKPLLSSEYIELLDRSRQASCSLIHCCLNNFFKLGFPDKSGGFALAPDPRQPPLPSSSFLVVLSRCSAGFLFESPLPLTGRQLDTKKRSKEKSRNFSEPIVVIVMKEMNTKRNRRFVWDKPPTYREQAYPYKILFRTAVFARFGLLLKGLTTVGSVKFLLAEGDILMYFITSTQNALYPLRMSSHLHIANC
ncbi:hypothetical protein AGMMS50249_2790 [candidate division SR1 bacterium]|nr:hypothetical protein AGMMS50249_2790 [candidate division SR1 bacterium]